MLSCSLSTMHLIYARQLVFLRLIYLWILMQAANSRSFSDNSLWQRITIPEIRNHEWFLKNLPADLMDDRVNNQFEEPDQPMQSIDEIMQIITEATIPAAGANSLNQYLTGSLDVDDDMEEDVESDPDLDLDSSGEIIYAM